MCSAQTVTLDIKEDPLVNSRPLTLHNSSVRSGGFTLNLVASLSKSAQGIKSKGQIAEVGLSELHLLP